jgi:hypothetical protein
MCDIFGSPSPDRSSMKKKITREEWEEAHEVSLSIIDLINAHEEVADKRKVLLALAIAYSTFCKVAGADMHTSLELVMTIYKNTEIIEDE